MKKLIVALALFFLLVSPAYADHVNGYMRSNGTYVQPYERSHADSTVQNNYSYTGNTNPYTGSTGTNNYIHDTTSPNYQGPDSQGRSGHSSNGYDSNPYGN